MTSSPTMLALVTDAFGGRGGIAQYNRDFLSALGRCRAVSSVVVLPRHAPDPVLPPPRASQAPPHSSRIGYVLYSLWVALGRHVDVVFCGHLYMAPLAALIAKFKGAKLIVQTHGIEAWRRPSNLQRAAVEGADLILCVSRHTRACVLSWAVIAPERVVVLPDTVGDTFVPGWSKMRAELELEEKCVLLTVGRMDSRERYKGYDRVIATLPSLVAQGLDVIYVVVGEGDDRSRVEELAREAGLDGRVRFLGAVGPQDLVDAYRMADLFVMPSKGEGFGIAFLEAMASGTPAIGLSVAGACDALADGELGSVVSDSQLPDALRRLLAAPKPNPGALAAAVRARFGRQTFNAQVDAILSGLLGAA